MIISLLKVQNFRCICDESLQCDRLTALVGPNGAGKSSFLRALEIFYTTASKCSEEDFYDRDTTKEIIITITFTNLTEEEAKLFQKYIEGGNLTVQKVIRWTQKGCSQKYYGTSLQNSEFGPFRSASGAGLKAEYSRLLKGKYVDLPEYSNKDEAEKALQDWELNHPDQCSRQRDEGQFFGFKEVGEAHLERYTRFLPIPAVRDASEDAEEGRGRTLTEIMDLVVRSVLAQRKEILELQEDTRKQYEQLVDPSKLAELQNLEKSLTDTLKTYVPDAGVKLTWLPGEAIEIPMPNADIKLLEDEYASTVERTGHGLQRAFILTMLQHLAVAQTPVQQFSGEAQVSIGEDQAAKSPPKTPNLIIGIEEPELYQHPNRQRHLSKILLELASGSIKGVTDCTQIVYTTHSPLFVDIKRINNIRVLRKFRGEENKPKQTKIIFTTLDNVAKIIEKADGKPEGSYTGKTLEPRLRTLMTPWMNEGFFADVAVLVEGEEDRAAIIGVSIAKGYNLESMGISVIPCMGKSSLIKPVAIFSNLNIPVYAIWDSDYGNIEASPEENHRLLRIFNQPVEDWPEKIADQFACFKTTLGKVLCAEIGDELFEDRLNSLCQDLDISKKKDAKKNPKIVEEIIKKAASQGKSSKTLEEIISKIVSLRAPL